MEKNYAMCKISCEIKCQLKDQPSRKIHSGDLVEIQNTVSNFSIIVILEENGKWSELKYLCKWECLIILVENAYPFLIAIKNREVRYNIAINVDNIKWISCLKVNNLVCYQHSGKETVKYECIIKYIGLVPEIGLGFYFGLKLTERTELNFNAYKDFIHKYQESDILVSAELITATEFAQTNSKFFDMHISALSGKYTDNPNLNRYQMQIIDNENYIKHSSNNSQQIRSKKEQYTIPEQLKSDNQNSNIKPNTIFCYDKTNIVVIDEHDIKESTKNANNINIVERAFKKPTQPTNNKANQFRETDQTVSTEKSSTDSENIKTAPTYKDALTGSIDPKQRIQKTDTTNFLPKTIIRIPGTDLEIGSLVLVDMTKKVTQKHGVIRWIGYLNSKTNTVHVGVELEEPIDNLGDGSYNGTKLFDCPSGQGLVISANRCTKDNRFEDLQYQLNQRNNITEIQSFGDKNCQTILSPALPAPKIINKEALEQLCGRYKGIQGHHNSCYLDATLFAMFSFTEVFDFLLFRRPEPNDSSCYENVQTVLREEIVNPLRKKGFVRADRVMKLRQLLDKFSSGSGYTTEEKDPEELLNNLLEQVLKAEPFLKLNSGQDAFYYQLFVEKNDKIQRPTVQQLFDQSFRSSDIKLNEVPSCLIIQMPRFGKNYKMYNNILPSQILDITDIIEDSPRQCSVCDKLAEIECRHCMKECEINLDQFFTFCNNCYEKAHNQLSFRVHHNDPRQIRIPPDFRKMENCKVPRLFMELFAVVCIETSHYVAFVKTGMGNKIPWCFFDSMADRKGEQNGHNIPEIVFVPEVSDILNEDFSAVNELKSKHAKRLLGDAYMCMYQSTDVMMYK